MKFERINRIGKKLNFFGVRLGIVMLSYWIHIGVLLVLVVIIFVYFFDYLVENDVSCEEGEM